MSFFSPQYVLGVYIPSTLLLIVVSIINRALLPYVVLFVAAVGGWKVYSGGTKDLSSGAGKEAHNRQDRRRC
jgi:cytochrome-b5 reductase